MLVENQSDSGFVKTGLVRVNLSTATAQVRRNDLIGGTIDFTFVDTNNAIAQAKGGKLRALGVTSPRRSSVTPDWPALAEKVPGFDVTAWFALLGPARLPANVVEKMNLTVAQILGQARILYAMSLDGLLPPIFARVHPTYRTPVAATLITGGAAAFIAGLITSLHCAGMCGPLACSLMPVRGVHCGVPSARRSARRRSRSPVLTSSASSMP